VARLRRDFHPRHLYLIKAYAVANRRIFANESDRDDFLARLQKYSKLFKVIVHAIHIADDHFELILEPKNRKGISRMMSAVLGRFSEAYNKRQGVRNGLPECSITKFPNFGSRFHACEVDRKHQPILTKMVAKHDATTCSRPPELPKDATPEQIEERDIIAAIILAVQWNRPYKYARARLGWWENRLSRRLARRHGSDPPDS
jgi:REP element-mobilizing transposase RayT